MIQYLKGDATYPQSDGTKLIAHIVNDAGKWGAGFTRSISNRWDQPERAYYEAFLTGSVRLGCAHSIYCEPDHFVVNMCAQHGVGRASKPFRVDALAKCLDTLFIYANHANMSVHMPRIGCGLGGSNWFVVEPIIAKHLKGVRVYIYDLQ